MIELDVVCFLFFPVEGTGPNPEWGDYSVVACCWGCMHLAVFGDSCGTWVRPLLVFSPP